MKKSEIKVGGYYRARVSGILVTVRVDDIETRNADTSRQGRTYYWVTNLRTNRRLTFQSAQKFRLEVNESGVPA